MTRPTTLALILTAMLGSLSHADITVISSAKGDAQRWRGRSAEDPAAAEAVLPAGVAFRDVLEGIDIIAFTRVPASVIGDLNGDGAVGPQDLAALLAAWS